MIELTDTNSSKIAAEFVQARTRAGSPAMGMVMTLIIVAPEEDAAEAMLAAKRASREHPSRVLGVILGDARGAAHVNAQVGSGDGWGGETALIRLKGEVVKHAESVVLPLLLPDSPVAIWWPTAAAGRPGRRPARRAGPAADHRLGRASRAASPRRCSRQCQAYAPGNTDLSWTRLTPWRALLAAALDQHPLKVTGAKVTAERVSPSADLLVAWLADRLKVDVARGNSDGPRHHRGQHGHQGGPDPHLARRRPARDVHLPRPARPAGRAQAARGPGAARRGAAPPRRGRRLRRHRRARWSSSRGTK